MGTFIKFLPKSNSKLVPGHFWPILLSNGQYGCGIVLDLPSKEKGDRRSFFAGLLDWSNKLKPTSEQLMKAKPKLIDQGKAHILTITSKGQQIEGYVDINELEIIIPYEVNSIEYSKYSEVLCGYKIIGASTKKDHQILPVRSTWGYDVINLLANKYLT